MVSPFFFKSTFTIPHCLHPPHDANYSNDRAGASLILTAETFHGLPRARACQHKLLFYSLKKKIIVWPAIIVPLLFSCLQEANRHRGLG